jgi:hypothetical protein
MEGINRKIITIASLFAIVILLIATSNGLLYGYYTFLRWAICITSILVGYAAYRLEKIGWVFIFGAVAILFNPIAPIYLNKDTWVIIDMGVAILFLISMFFIKEKKK